MAENTIQSALDWHIDRWRERHGIWPHTLTLSPATWRFFTDLISPDHLTVPNETPNREAYRGIDVVINPQMADWTFQLDITR